MELNTQQIRLLRSLFSNPEWINIRAKWLLSCPRGQANNDVELIRNAVGFDYWHRSVDAFERAALDPAKSKPERDKDALEYENDMSRPPA